MRAGRQPGDPAAGETQDVVAVGWEKEELASGPQGSGLWPPRADFFEWLLLVTAGEDWHFGQPVKEKKNPTIVRVAADYTNC